MTWDKRSQAQIAKLQDAGVKRQLGDLVGPFSPFWREQLKALGRKAATVDSVEALTALPAVGERDLCPDGDPLSAARLVLQADERGFAVHAAGPQFRAAFLRRLVAPAAYRRAVDSTVRPTAYHLGGHALALPMASTRSDLDLIARAGARAWRVLGLTRSDVLVSALPLGQGMETRALEYAALAAGSPALLPGPDPVAVAEALALVPATVLALPADSDLLTELGSLGGVTTVLLVGAPTQEQRAAAREALSALGSTAAVLGLYGPRDGRVLYAECRESATLGRSLGYHTYPDLEVLQTVDLDAGEGASAGGELVLTQLGFWGSALVRWRTGDVTTAPLETGECPGCGRTVPRVPASVRPAALVPVLDLRDLGEVALDLRAVTGALAGRPDLADWRVEVARSDRDGRDQLLIGVVPAAGARPGETAAAAHKDVRRASGVAPTQVIVEQSRPRHLSEGSVSDRVLVRH